MQSKHIQTAIPSDFKEKWAKCLHKVKSQFATLIAELKDGYPINKCFLYYREEGGFNFESDTYEIVMYSNGVCTLFDQIIRERDTITSTSYLGVYFLQEDKIEAKLLAYRTTSGCNYDVYQNSDKVIIKRFDVISSKRIKGNGHELELC